MNMSSLLPRRWRSKRDATRHAEAITGILDTPPIVATRDDLDQVLALIEQTFAP